MKQLNASAKAVIAVIVILAFVVGFTLGTSVESENDRHVKQLIHDCEIDLPRSKSCKLFATAESNCLGNDCGSFELPQD